MSATMKTDSAADKAEITITRESSSSPTEMKLPFDVRKLTPKRQARKRQMKYEEMLMQDIPGTSNKTNQAMHAVLESNIEDTDEEFGKSTAIEDTVKVRNHALIHYIAQLAISNHDNDTFDFAFVESLIKNGADINAKDKHGQTIFHEVSRSWHLDVAQFLLKHGAQIDEQDKYGRAPIHVAAAVDYAQMVEFLLNNNANVNIRTYGEKQAPIHFAAKNDACLSLKMLIAYGVDIGARDYQERTPLQVAAGLGRSKAAKLLVDMGAPAGVYDNKGEVALSLLIQKMPEVAVVAMNQLHSVDMINRKEYYFLNYLEGPRLSNDKTSAARTPLEVAIQTQQFDIIMHPVMQRVLYIKWQKFGKRGAWLDLAANVLLAIVWTIFAVTIPYEADKLYEPLKKNWWRLLLGTLVIFLGFLEIFKQVASIYRLRTSLTRWKGHRVQELESDLPYCHPRWPEEKRYLDSEIKTVKEQRILSSQDSWFYIDWLALMLIVASGVTHAVFYFINTIAVYNIHIRFVCSLLIVIWFRVMKYARPFKRPGPFVALLGHMLGDILKWILLFFVFFIPYTSCFWMVFGANSRNITEGYETLFKLLYSVFGMTVLDKFEFEKLDESDPFMAKILCGSYIFICSIVILNLLIALLADTFTRIHENAIENAAMQRAKTILNLQQSLGKTEEDKYYEYLSKNCSPEMKDYEHVDSNETDRDKRRRMEDMRVRVNQLHTLVTERIEKRFGSGPEKPEFDEAMDKISPVFLVTAKIRTFLQLTNVRLEVVEERLRKISVIAPLCAKTVKTKSLVKEQKQEFSASFKSMWKKSLLKTKEPVTIDKDVVQKSSQAAKASLTSLHKSSPSRGVSASPKSSPKKTQGDPENRVRSLMKQLLAKEKGKQLETTATEDTTNTNEREIPAVSSPAKSQLVRQKKATTSYPEPTTISPPLQGKVKTEYLDGVENSSVYDETPVAAATSHAGSGKKLEKTKRIGGGALTKWRKMLKGQSKSTTESPESKAKDAPQLSGDTKMDSPHHSKRFDGKSRLALPSDLSDYSETTEN